MSETQQAIEVFGETALAWKQRALEAEARAEAAESAVAYWRALAQRALERAHQDKDFWQVCGAPNCVCTEYREAVAANLPVQRYDRICSGFPAGECTNLAGPRNDRWCNDCDDKRINRLALDALREAREEAE